MGAAFYIVLDRDEPGFDTSVDGKYLAREAGRLGGLADSLGMDHLDAFVSYSTEHANSIELEDEGEGGPDGPPAEVVTFEERWFGAGEGVDWFTKVLDAVSADPSRFKHPKGIVADLKEFRALLVKTQAIGARWHLEIGF